ncbi:MAG: N-methyl-L-tryptophan oxidase [Armatimonadetes bacterium]|nr:N-methyl-L-tryptophan oxidase [Armatimonadota bacterium]
MAEPFDVLVVGAGINGLSALYHLSRRCSRVGLVEQYRLGHERGSSHGHSRITRVTYSDPKYVALAHRAQTQDWPGLEAECSQQLLIPCEGCYFGPGIRPFMDALEQVPPARQMVEVLTPKEARGRFAPFPFKDSESVVVDHSGGLLAAARILDALAALARSRGAEILEETAVQELELEPDPMLVRTNRGELRCRRLVIAAGPWTSRWIPPLREHLRVTRQVIGYFRPEGPAERWQPGSFPVWVRIGRSPEDFFYGLPEFGRPGLKLARHNTTRAIANADAVAFPTPDEIGELQDFLREHLGLPTVTFEGAENCLYTNAPGENFVLAALPGNERVVVASGFTGHGFKFGPVTGAILSDLVLEGGCDIPEFARYQEDFAFPRVLEV